MPTISGLSAKEQELYDVMRSEHKLRIEVVEGTPNWDDLAKKAHVNTAKQAQWRWTLICKKLMGEGEEKKVGVKRSKGTDDEGDNGSSATPEPKKAKGKANGKGGKAASKTAVVKKEDEDAKGGVIKEEPTEDDNDALDAELDAMCAEEESDELAV